ncbi:MULTISPECIES: pilus assembly FimT family protein [Methylomonas]|uniref:Uncharacterized protein n=2 Tax=Methylomonas TaxID=416 RepID=A0A140E623_9GAMM|nr:MULTISPECIES: prepilin-type N-terminal cleavage/methylation domain-containing protein [Methylomonas]AMK78847.1 hypothetical protein JT25_020565 [Methylomonas denitrificans]OAI02121.1 hypothetical protein A1342_02495 [Methylomonas methanica]TCV78289.1 MSHA pilin protein MshC [Methylomonas methanica]
MIIIHLNSNRSSSGFTLVELTMTIVILGILSATALPKFFDLSVYQERAFFDDTINAIRYAQKLAVATGCNVQVQISANQFELKRPTVTDRSQCASTISANFGLSVARPGSGESSYQGSQSGINLSTTTFYFTAKGDSSADEQINIGSNGKQISVVKDTGFVYDSSS